MAQVPKWVPDGHTKDTLKRHGNLWGFLPNKLGEDTICTVETDGKIVFFSQANAAGDGQSITVTLTGPDYIRQLDRKAGQ